MPKSLEGIKKLHTKQQIMFIFVTWEIQHMYKKKNKKNINQNRNLERILREEIQKFRSCMNEGLAKTCLGNSWWS